MGTLITTSGKKVKLTSGQRAALEATRKFRSLVPSLQSYARRVTGNPEVKVTPGHTTQTDGETIWIKPPFELSKPINHTTCGEVDKDMFSTCEGCRVMQGVMLYLHHEMSHIMYGSFERYKFDGQRSSAVIRRLNKHAKYGTPEIGDPWNYTFDEENTLAIAGAVYPPLVAVVQALEDHRINEAHYSSGHDDLRQQMKADSQKLIDEGIKDSDGNVTSWGDASRDAQMMIQMLFDLQGNKTDHILDPEVLKDYEELGVAKVIKPAAKQQDSLKLLYLAAEATGLCHTRGYFQKGADMQGLLDLLRILFGHDILDEGAGQKLDGNGGLGTSEAERQELDEFHEGLKDALMSGTHIEGMPLNIAGLTLHEYPKGNAYDSGYGGLEAASVSARNRAVSKARLVFEENSRVEYHRNQRRGKLNSRVLGKRAALGDERLFAKRIVPDTRTYGVVIGLDISGSTSGERLRVIKETASAMADVCKRTGVKFEMFAHTGGMESIPATDKTAANVYQIKSLSEPWDSKRQSILANIGCGGINLDGHTMQFYRKRLDNSGCTDNVLFYFTDGSMPAANYDEERDVLEAELKLMKKRGYTVVGVGVDTDSPKQYGLDTVIVHGPNDIAAVLDKMASRIG